MLDFIYGGEFGLKPSDLSQIKKVKLVVAELLRHPIYVDNITDFSQPISSVLGSSLLLYHFDASVTDNQIRWTTERVDPEVVKKYDPEFENPVPLSTVFSDVGGGRHDLTCFYRNSPATVLGVIDLSLKGMYFASFCYLNIVPTLICTFL